jgi:hypothetical protein
MDRLAALFEQLSLPEIARLLRRTAFSAIGVGVVALGVSIALSHPLVGLGVCCGLGLGLVNIRLVARSVAKINAAKVTRPARVLASRTVTRLGMTTLIIVGLIFASLQVGLGTAVGIAVFYLVLLANLLRSLLGANTNGAPV